MELPNAGIGDKRIVDGCASVTVTVTALLLRQNGWQAEVAWWNCGTLCDAWVTVDRLSPVPA